VGPAQWTLSLLNKSGHPQEMQNFKQDVVKYVQVSERIIALLTDPRHRNWALQESDVFV
jgi:hypothetical protein